MFGWSKGQSPAFDQAVVSACFVTLAACLELASARGQRVSSLPLSVTVTVVLVKLFCEDGMLLFWSDGQSPTSDQAAVSACRYFGRVLRQSCQAAAGLRRACLRNMFWLSPVHQCV